MRRHPDGRFWWHLSWREFTAGYRWAARLPVLRWFADAGLVPGSRAVEQLTELRTAAWRVTD